jgi:hypothetical protein
VSVYVKLERLPPGRVMLDAHVSLRIPAPFSLAAVSVLWSLLTSVLRCLTLTSPTESNVDVVVQVFAVFLTDPSFEGASV